MNSHVILRKWSANDDESYSITWQKHVTIPSPQMAIVPNCLDTLERLRVPTLILAHG